MVNIKESDNKIQAHLETNPSASETVKGIIRIATEEEVLAGVDNSTAITPKKLSDVVGTISGTVSTLSGTVANHTEQISTISGTVSNLSETVGTLSGTVTAHASNTSNPHSVTKTQVGLGNCDNTSDLDKPVSTATQTAIDNVSATISGTVSTLSGTVANHTNQIGTINGTLTNHSNQISTINATLPLKADKTTLHALKGYADNGELLSGTEGLSDVNYYAHSTFDATKFTKVGSPIINVDGIVSGFGSNDYLTTTQKLYGTSWKLKARIKPTVNTVNNNNQSIAASRLSSGNCDFNLFVSKNGENLTCIFKNSDNTTIATMNASGVLTVDTLQLVELRYTNQTLSYFVNGVQVGTPVSVNLDSWVSNSNLQFGYDWYNSVMPFRGAIDLRYIEIVINVVPVFSGNKTGIDIIKPDDYTVVGTPTISADGVASGFSSSNYLTASLNFTYNNTCKIIFPFTTGSDITTTQRIYYMDSPDNALTLSINNQASKKPTFGWRNVNNQSTILINPANFTLNPNTLYLFKLEDNNTNIIVSIKSISDTSWTQLATQTKTANLLLSGTLTIGKSGSSGINQPFLGSIDLNAFKIYVDGNLVYQPCLKIPYTESKTGSKIVDSYYRDRVSDMYEQFGYAPYYTLSDTDFTLPQGELYGLIQRQSFAPSDKYDELTLGASGDTYTAPADGYFTISKFSTDANQYVNILNTKTGLDTAVKAPNSLTNIRVFLPVAKNDVVQVNYTAGGSSDLFRFIYAVGSESEAN